LFGSPLLARPQPDFGESLFSFISRIAKENDTTQLALTNLVGCTNSHSIQKTDLHLLDTNPSSLIDIPKLCQLTRCTPNQVLNASLCNVLRVFHPGSTPERSRFMSGMIRNTLHFCPECLKESTYFRLIWRVEGTIGCLNHQRYLQSECTSCKREIAFRDVCEVGICPYCGASLTASPNTVLSLQESDRTKQAWWYQAWEVLLDDHPHKHQPHELAMMLLYVLNDKKASPDMGYIAAHLRDKKAALQTLLQHARRSLAQSRTLHLSLLVDTLYEFNFRLDEFFNLAVPHQFIDAILQQPMRRIDQLACMAPWCANYRVLGALIKTGTTVKRLKSGQRLLYYSACTECGCEYAVDGKGILKERTCFIEFYKITEKREMWEWPIKRISRDTGFSADKVKRCLAYFKSRLNVSYKPNRGGQVNNYLVTRFVDALSRGTVIKAIQHWEEWHSYNDFLLHRYHPSVMRALIDIHRPHQWKVADKAEKKQQVVDTLDEFLKADQTITVGTVCTLLGLHPETLRNWGTLNVISEAKQHQTETRKQQLAEYIYKTVTTYLKRHDGVQVTSAQVYIVIGQQRTVLWRKLPEVTAWIAHQLKVHNAG
jgi:hypothetical protein